MNYSEFIQTKAARYAGAGIEINTSDVHPLLMPFQRDIVRWACAKGRCAVFADTGLGKTYIQLEWARLMGQNTLIIAPLSVARQTARMAADIGLDVRYVRSQAQVTPGHRLWITNYEMLDHMDADAFGAVVLDESSILKALDGKTRRKLTEMFARTPYRLACTATPAPNDRTEIGNHAEFLGITTMTEMLSMFFVHANKETTVEMGGFVVRKKQSNDNGQEWRLKHHAEDAFYRWMASWAMSIRRPSDLGYDDDGFILPPLNITPRWFEYDYRPADKLVFTGLDGLSGHRDVLRQTTDIRAQITADMVNASDEQWIVWCHLNSESSLVSSLIPDCVEIVGADSPERKAEAIEAFQDGQYRVLVTKPSIAGFGMNFQNAHNQVFVGLSYSWEEWYQAIRRCYRFGQTKPVNVHVVLTEVERDVYNTVMSKEAVARAMAEQLIAHVRRYEMDELQTASDFNPVYQTDTVTGDTWTAMLGDSCQRLRELDDNSIDLSVYSPPFADLYTYSNSEFDLGNSRNYSEFFGHYAYIIREVLRVTKPGRSTCVHVADIPAMAVKDGYIGIKDFPGDVVRAYEAEGWVFFGRAIVAKNPQAQAIRTKAKGLLFVQLRKDSADSRPAILDHILIFKKPGTNATPITPVDNGEVDNETWIDWAGGIWTGIDEGDTLQYQSARDGNDEKHVCPLQLGTIERCIKLYSNPGETVLTPFMGIGSEAYEAVRLGRRAIGIELKESYFATAVKNLRDIEIRSQGPNLFNWMQFETVSVAWTTVPAGTTPGDDRMNQRDADNLKTIRRAIRSSDLESTLAWQVRVDGLPAPEQEYRFDDNRRWRFDFAWPNCRLAVEVNGGEWSEGRHNRGGGMADDYEKLNAAVIAGWRVLQFTGSQVRDGVAVETIRRALAEFDV